MSSLLLALALLAQARPRDREWNQPVEPQRIVDNVYYVGASEITSFLVTTPEGHFLLDAGFVETVPQIIGNILKLGFQPEDVKFLLNTHAHYDHAAGFADLKSALPGAKLAVMEPDAALIERGGLGDFAFGDKFPYPKAKVDRVLHPGEVLTLGGTSMTAVHTPGHTKGCTTWTLHTVSGHDVVFNCSVSVPGYQLKNNPANPGIVDDYRRTFDTLDKLPCDVLLGAHGSFFQLKEKLVSHAWVDPAGCTRWKAGARKNFEEQLAKQ